MRHVFLRSITLGILSLVLVTACAKPKKADTDADANANAAANAKPDVVDRSNTFDPQGSDSGKIDGLNTVFFEYDKATLTSSTKKALSNNAGWIKAHNSATIQIEGHTDARGTVEYNLALGERRAKSVKAYLEGLGVDTKHLTVISYGEEKPMVQGDTEAAFSKNRRANFVPLQ